MGMIIAGGISNTGSGGTGGGSGPGSGQRGPDTALFTLTASSGFSLTTSALKSFSWSKNASFNTQEIINRSSQVFTYKNSSAIEFHVTIDLIALGEDGDNWNAQMVQHCIKSLASLCFPRQQGLLPPPLCQITYGSGIIFNAYNCILTSVAPSDSQVYDSKGDPFYSSVTLSLTGIELQFQSDTDFDSQNATTYSNLSFTTSEGG